MGSTLALANIVSILYLGWVGLCGALNSKFPVLVVLSDSMYPTFKKGDILILSNHRDYMIVGDICVFKLENRSIPIVHRIVEKYSPSIKNPISEEDGGALYLTKGDNNILDDRMLYPKGTVYLNDEQFIGRIVGIIPKIGSITLAISEYKYTKILSLLILLVNIMA